MESQVIVFSALQKIESNISSLEAKIDSMGTLYKCILGNVDASNQLIQETEVESLDAQINNDFTSLEKRLRETRKSSAFESRSHSLKAGQIERKLQELKEKHRNQTSNFQRKSRVQTDRRARIIYPAASTSELQIEHEPRMFANAIFAPLSTRATRQNVESRHEQIKKATATLGETFELQQRLTERVLQQESPLIINEQKSEEAGHFLESGNVYIEKAKSSRRASKKIRWWCFLISGVFLFNIAIIELANNFFKF